MYKVYNALDIARYIIKRCNFRNQAISNLKLQKILYFVQAEFLVTKNVPCFKERIEAWNFGPVVPDVYHYYKGYGAGNIPVLRTFANRTLISESDQELINGIVDECAQYSASELVDITHRQTPWKSAYKAGFNQPISNESIKDFFEED